MLRGNLSSRPFYNERLVSLAMVLVAVGGIGLTAYNVTRLMALSSQRRALGARIEQNQSETARVRAETTAVGQSVNGPLLNVLAGSAREANDLIDRRTFSWTVFFDLVEKTMPFDVRLVSVSPLAEKGTFKVSMTVVARRAGNVQEFIDALVATGVFYDVVPADQALKDDSTYTAVVEASYLPPAAPVEPGRAGGAPAPKKGEDP